MARDAPGRLSTAYGSLASSHDLYQVDVRAEEALRKSIEVKEARRLAKKSMEERDNLSSLCSVNRAIYVKVKTYETEFYGDVFSQQFSVK